MAQPSRTETIPLPRSPIGGLPTDPRLGGAVCLKPSAAHVHSVFPVKHADLASFLRKDRRLSSQE